MDAAVRKSGQFDLVSFHWLLLICFKSSSFAKSVKISPRSVYICNTVYVIFTAYSVCTLFFTINKLKLWAYQPITTKNRMGPFFFQAYTMLYTKRIMKNSWKIFLSYHIQLTKKISALYTSPLDLCSLCRLISLDIYLNIEDLLLL